MALPDGEKRVIVRVVVLLVDEFHVEALRHHSDQRLASELGEILSEADALAAGEWKEGMGMALFTFGSFREWMRWIESLWEEFVRSLPLVAIQVQAFNVDDDVVTSLDSDPADLGVFWELIDGRVRSSGSAAQCFLPGVGDVFKIANVLVGQLVFNGSLEAS